MKAAELNHVRIPIGYWAYDISRGQLGSYVTEAILY